MEHETSHRFVYGQLIFTTNCECGEEIELTNPWFGEVCSCGRQWFLNATATSEDAADDEDELPNDLPGEEWARS